MRRLNLLLVSIFSIFLFSFTSKVSDLQLKNGDIVFIESTSGQGKAIQLATKSKMTHVGIVFIENGKPMIYHAVEPVMKSSVDEFRLMSNDGALYVKRLKDQSVLTEETISKMLKEAKSKLGIHYDYLFGWTDEQLYCSEFVWKLYNHNLGINIGKLKQLKDFDLSHPVVKFKLQERYGNNIPLKEEMISPGDMYNSELLQ
jgi:uncharacterized protein YycO